MTGETFTDRLLRILCTTTLFSGAFGAQYEYLLVEGSVAGFSS